MFVIVRNWISLLACVSISCLLEAENLIKTGELLLFVFPLGFLSRVLYHSCFFYRFVNHSLQGSLPCLWHLNSVCSKFKSLFFIITCPTLLFSSKYWSLLCSVLSFISFPEYWVLSWGHWSHQNYCTCQGYTPILISSVLLIFTECFSEFCLWHYYSFLGLNLPTSFTATAI